MPDSAILCFWNASLYTFQPWSFSGMSGTTRIPHWKRSCYEPYYRAGNDQVEKYNGTVWKAVTMVCKSKNLPIKYWQEVLPDVLHSLRSLLCTATNEMPHECLFCFARRSTSGSSVPTWLATPGPVFLKRHVRASKMEPLVDEVELLGANTNYAHIRYPDGRTTTVSTKHLTPRGELDSSLPQTSL